MWQRSGQLWTLMRTELGRKGAWCGLTGWGGTVGNSAGTSLFNHRQGVRIGWGGSCLLNWGGSSPTPRNQGDSNQKQSGAMRFALT